MTPATVTRAAACRQVVHAHDGRLGVLLPAQLHPDWRQHFLQVPARAVVTAAVANDAVARRVLAKGVAVQVGQRVGVRLNLNIARTQGVLLHSVHEARRGDGHRCGRGSWNGEVLAYEEYLVLDDAWFNVDQRAREAIAAGKTSKYPMASVDGVLRATGGLTRIDGVELAFNPKREHLFVDPRGIAVQWAEEVIVVGHRCYARGAMRLHTAKSAPIQVGSAASRARLASG